MKDKKGFFAEIHHDFPASIVVFLVALPLCLGIALASGAPLFSGIIAGVVGGLIVASISGSALGVSGPAAGLTVIVVSSIHQLGSFEAFLMAVMLGGLFQIVLGIIKAGVIGYYFPSSVIKGMLSGIGILIVLKQIPHAFGYDKDPEGDFFFIQSDGHNTFSELSYMLDVISPGAIIITFISLLILFFWSKPFIANKPLFKVVNGPLVVVVSGIILDAIFQDNIYFHLNDDQVVNIPVLNSWSELGSLITFPDFSMWNNTKVYTVGFTIAVVASLETLLSVEASDKLDPYKRITPTNRELIAQGIGNMVSGLIGGLPVTQVIVRSSANAQTGGKTKASAIMHGALLLISALLIPSVMNLIPLSSLAAILFMVGYKLAKPSIFIEMYKKGNSEFIPYLVTIIAMIFTDLLTGIGLGIVVAIFNILWNNFKTPYHFDPHSYEENSPIIIQLSEDVTFLNKASILNTFNLIPEGTSVVIDASRNVMLHPDIEEIIYNFQLNAKTRNIYVTLKGFDKDTKVDAIYDIQERLKH